INVDNNRRAVMINVAEDTSKVLLVDGEGRWEFHYIWQALLRDQSMKVKSVLFQQPRLASRSADELQQLHLPLSALPAVPEEGKETEFLKLASPQDLLDPMSRHPLVEPFKQWCREHNQQADSEGARLYLQEIVHGWTIQPPHFWGVTGKAKAGATTLAFLKLE